MTKQEWMTDVVAKFPEDNKILVWAIMAEDDDSYNVAIGEEATGGEQMTLAANLLKHMAKNLKTSPISAAKAALAYDKMKEALKEGAENSETVEIRSDLLEKLMGGGKDEQ